MSWVSIDIWKAVSVWRIICTEKGIVSSIVVCNRVSIIYLCELARVLSGITWGIAIVVLNHVGAAVSGCALTAWCACLSSWAVWAGGAICCGHCGNYICVRVEVWTVNDLVVTRVSLKGRCTSGVYISSQIRCWIVVGDCWCSVCAGQTVLISQIFCAENSIVGSLSKRNDIISVGSGILIILHICSLKGGCIWIHNKSTASSCCTLAGGSAGSTDYTIGATCACWCGHCWESSCIAWHLFK